MNSSKIISINNRQALLALGVLTFFLLSPVTEICFGQVPMPTQKICDGTQFRTDNRGLVFVPKGQKETLLIRGIWYECEGCSACVPISNTRTQAAIPPWKLFQRQQELSDEQMIEILERTKELMAPVKSQDEARRRAEYLAFQESLFFLSRDLKNLQNESIAQYKGLRLKLQDLAERVTTIKEMGNIARWSLEAARSAHFGESARPKAGWGFDEWGRNGGVMDFSVFSPQVSVPETQNPQFLAFKYIANWASDMYTKLLRLSERKTETEKKGWELKTKRRNEYEPLPLTTRLTEEQKKKQEYLSDLEKQAEALLKEAEQMSETATKYTKEISEMQKDFFQLVNDPSKSASFLERHLGKK